MYDREIKLNSRFLVKYRFLVLLFALSVLLLSFSIASQNWWDGNWRYRQPITITNNEASLLSNFQVKIELNTQIFISQGKLQSSCEDLRFVDDSTVLSHWIESGCNSAQTIVWVKLTTLEASSDKDIYLYYDNSGASDISNGDETFAFFDDFSTLNSTRWQTTGSASVSNGKLTVATGAVVTYNTILSTPVDYIFETKIKWTTSSGSYSGLEIADDHSTAGSNSGRDALVYLMTQSGSMAMSAWAANGATSSYNIVSGSTQFTAVVGTEYIMGFSLTSSQLRYYNDRSVTNTYSNSWDAPVYLWVGYFTGRVAGTTNIKDAEYDWIIVRKLALNEPSTSFGSEELVCDNDGICETGEDYLSCSNDCCRFDGTACTSYESYTTCSSDNSCHSECDGVHGSVSTECVGLAPNTCAGSNEGLCGSLCTYSLCSGCSDCSGGSCSVNDHSECLGTNVSCQCVGGSCNACSSAQYCSSAPACTDCSTTCDDSCVSANCFGIDPDCDISGNANLACCGNGQCDGSSGENCETCVADCGACPLYCGDGSCDASKGENNCTCVQDCGICSGDAPGTCKKYDCVSGTCSSVSKSDCCGNNICEDGETISNCEEDCQSFCGDDFCDASEGEDTCSCSLDCGTCGGDAPGICKEYACVQGNCTSVAKDNCCGNNVCEVGESYLLCATDCQSVCGDAYCNAASGENNCSCSLDCGSCGGDAPGTCKQYACLSGSCSTVSKENCCGNNICETGESHELCPDDCPPQCGDDVCNVGDGENRCNCALDCGYCSGPAPGNCKEFKCEEETCVTVDSIYCCGNGQCDPNENSNNCPSDCQGICGDKICDASIGENECTCSIDCGLCDVEFPSQCFRFQCNDLRRCVRVNMTNCCGNSICEIEENSKTCSKDCKVQCGDGRCEVFANETCENCAVDCGICPPFCGDNKCNAGENTCNCATDCGTCDGECGICKEFQCLREKCVCLPILFCCGNLRCESNEHYGICSHDCHPESLDLTFITPKKGKQYMRGESLHIKANASLNKQYPALNSHILLITDVGVIQLFDDGKHNDNGANDSIYGASLELFSDAPPGKSFLLELQGSFASKTNASSLVINGKINETIDVTSALQLDIQLSKQSYNLTDEIKVNCSILDIAGKKRDSDVTFTLSNEDTVLEHVKDRIEKDKTCVFSYRSTLLDSAGEWQFNLYVQDDFNNTGSEHILINMVEPAKKSFLELVVESPISAAYFKGHDLTFSVNVYNNNVPINDADVKINMPDLPVIKLKSFGDGKYTDVITVPWGYKYDEVTLQIIAKKSQDNSIIAGAKSVKIKLVSPEIKIALIEPKKSSFKKGEKVKFIFQAQYPDGSPVNAPEIDISIEDNVIPFKSTENGFYVAEYVMPEKEGTFGVKINVSDSFGNIGDDSLEINSRGVATSFFVKKNKEILTGLLITLTIVAIVLLFKTQLKFKRNRLIHRIKELETLEQELQNHYFEDGSISRNEFELLYDKYDRELSELQTKLGRMKK